MIKARKLTGAEGTAVEVELSPVLFEFSPKPYQTHQYVKMYLKNQRQGTHATKTRAQVSGGGVQPWRQKGTGRARTGSNTSPIWVGGGIIWGPHPRDYYSSVPKQLKRQAIRTAFTQKASHNRILIMDEFKMDKPRTRTIVEFLTTNNLYGQKVLFLMEGHNRNFELSCRNIPGVDYRHARVINAYDVLNADYVLLTEPALKTVEEVFGK